MTFLAALRCDPINAPRVLDWPINGQSFTAYIEQYLVPALVPGNVVIMDNLLSHKKPAVRTQSEAPGRGCFSCRPTAPTSTQSSRSLPNSKNSFANPPNDST
jgi:hypothetical protein